MGITPARSGLRECARDRFGGNVYAATGNGYSGGTFDYSESVLRLEPSLHLVEYWAPAEWLELDEHDGDLGSSNPMVLPNGLVFEIGKSGEGVLLRPGAFGGVGATPAASISVCGSWGGGIYVPASAEAGTLYVSCLGGGLRAVSVRELNAAEPKLSAAPGWSVPSQAIGPPIFAGDLVWATHWNEDVSEGGGVLYGINPTTGHVQFEEPLGAFEHFATPSAGGGRLFVANNAQVTAFGIAIPPAPSATSTLLGSSANPSLAGRGVRPQRERLPGSRQRERRLHRRRRPDPGLRRGRRQPCERRRRDLRHLIRRGWEPYAPRDVLR